MFEISKIAYDLYVQDWIDEHTTPELRLQNIREYYSYVRECLVDEIEPDTYKDWLSEYGFNGSLCVCYEEFCDMEYHDKDYIRYLLSEDNELIEMYYQDIEDYLEEEALSCEDTIEKEKKYFEANLVNYDDNNVDKYAVAKEVALENFKNALECIDYNPDDYTEEELQDLFDTLSDKLANDDTYNAIYNEALEEILKEYEKAKETNLEKTIDKAIADAEAKSKQQENNDKSDIDLEI